MPPFSGLTPFTRRPTASGLRAGFERLARARGISETCGMSFAFYCSRRGVAILGAAVARFCFADIAEAAEVAPPNPVFKKVAGEMDAAMQADNTAAQKAPLSFPQGEGLRVLMTGHSWVAPGRITLPEIAHAAGYKDHVQREHT